MTLDELDFKLIIDDAEFTATVTRLKDDAKKLNTELSNLLNITSKSRIVSPEDVANMEKLISLLNSQDKAEKKLNNKRKKRVEYEKQITAELEKQSRTSAPQSVVINEDNSKTINNMREGQARFNKEVERSTGLFGRLKELVGQVFTFHNGARLVSNLVRVTAEFEKQRISLEAILKDVSGADRIFEQMKDLAVKSPFQFKELVTYTKQLSAFSVPMEELYDTTKMLADVSAGLGVGMDRLILAYGQIRSASFLRGQEVRQLTEAGVPILKELSKQLTEIEGKYVSVGEVFDKISARQVTFEMVEKVFKGMTEEGGKFYKMQEVLAETLSGKISNLKDAYQIMFAEIGEKTSGIMVKTVDKLRDMAENYESIGRKILQFVAIYGVFKSAVVIADASHLAQVGKAAGAVTPALDGLTGSIGNNMKALKGLATMVTKLKNPYVLLAVGIAALVAVIYNLATATDYYGRVKDVVEKKEKQFLSDVENEQIKLKFLFKQLENATKGTEEYETAKKKIINSYDKYLSDIDKENLALGNQVKVYEKLVIAVRQAAAEKAMEEGSSEIGEQLTRETKNILNQFDKVVESYSRSNNVADAVWDQIGAYIRGEIDKGGLTEEGERVFNAIQDGMEQARLKARGGKKSDYYWEIYGDLEGLREAYKRAGDFAEDQMTEIQRRLNRLYGPNLGKQEEETILKQWQKGIQDIIDEADAEGIRINLKVDENSTLATVVGDVMNNIEDTTKSLKIAEGIEENVADIERKRLGYLERINQSVLGGKATPGGGSGAAGDNRIKQIQEEIKAYQRLQAAYEQLTQYMDEHSAREALGTFYGDMYGSMVGENFEVKIRQLASDLADLGEEGQQAAASLFEGFAKEAFDKFIDGIKEAEKATADFEEMMAGLGDVFPLEGGGVALDIQKIVRDYQAGIAKIQKAQSDAIDLLDAQALASGMSDTDYENYLGQITTHFATMTSNALVEARDKAVEALRKYYEEMRGDLSNLADKSINQLTEMKARIEQFSNADIDPKILEFLETLGLYVDEVSAELDEMKGKDIEEVTGEIDEKKVRKWKEIAENILDVTDALHDLGEETNNQGLVDFADFASGLADVTKNVLAGFKSGGVVGAIVGGVSTIAVKLLDAATAAAKVKNELKEIATQAYLDSITKQIDATATIFGDNWLGKVQEVQRAIKELRGQITALGQVTNGLSGIGMVSMGQWLEVYARELGMEMYDENGIFQTAFLDAVEAAYAKTLKQRGLYDEFQKIKTYNDELIELFEQLDSTVGEIFSDLGDSITDALIEKLWETGEAVTDLQDIFQGLGNTIMRSLIQSLVMDEVLNKYKDEVKSWWAMDYSAEELAGKLDEFAANVESDLAGLNDFIVGIFNAFTERNLISNGSSATEGMGTAIKGVTEETANLLASYINAIRADVAYNRLQLEDVRGDVRLMLGLLPQSPTLAEYLTQIQANTFNSAQNTQDILAHLVDLTTTIGGSPSIRVSM